MIIREKYTENEQTESRKNSEQHLLKMLQKLMAMQNKTGIINSLLKMKNDKPLNTLAQLRKGEKGIIDSFTDVEISLKLLEMGCLPGEMIEVKNIAPFGDPIAITVGGYTLGLRKDEASTVIIKCI